MPVSEKVTELVGELVESGIDLYSEVLKAEGKPFKLSMDYEAWFTRASAVVRQLDPHRLSDFNDLYRLPKRKALNVDTYCIHDYLMGFVISEFGKEKFSTKAVFLERFLNQIGILKGAFTSASSILSDIKTALRAELSDSDLSAARELFSEGHLRPSGVLAGVVLEGQLKGICRTKGYVFQKKHVGLSDLNDRLKDEKIYDQPQWRFVQHLTDLRNLACHKGDREPKREEIQDLLEGVDKILKTVN